MIEYHLIIIAVLYIVICPYTKVEESFNLQAIHDILYHGSNISEYDHLEFPGVVPRTFLGPIVVAFISYPFFFVSTLLNLNKFSMQYIVRAILGVLVMLGFGKFYNSIQRCFGPTVGIFLQLVTASQFHFMFYSTRPLPNTFALILVMLAYSYWLESDHRMLILLTAASVVIFRAELCILFGLIILEELLMKRLEFVKLLWWGILSGVCMLGLTVVVDSYFWQRPLWPEGEVLWFNLVLNKSSQWGTSPWPWYFYSALPRALLSSIIFIPLGNYLDSRVRALMLPAFGFVIIYSLLPHKELRFIIYTIPLFNVAVARAYSQLWHNKRKTLIHTALCITSCLLLLLNFLGSAAMLNISHYNYPGGFALSRLHELEADSSKVYVHIDTYSAQTGVSRFLELYPDWRYSKAEDIAPDSVEMLQFSHLLYEWPNNQPLSSLPLSSTHSVMDVISAFSRWSFDISQIPPVITYLKPSILILKRRISEQPLIVNATRIQSLQM